MAVSCPARPTTTTTSAANRNPSQVQHPQKHHQQPQQQRRRRKKHPKPPSSWEQFKNLLTCRSTGSSQVHNPPNAPITTRSTSTNTSKSGKLGSSCSDICSFKDVVHGNTRVVHRGDHDQSPDDASANGSSSGGHLGLESSLLSLRSSARRSDGVRGTQSRRSTNTHHPRGMQFRKLSGCYECRAISEPTRYPGPRTICTCPDCGQVFTKTESLDLHQTICHAVSELGQEDSGRNIVEIIFKSSWVKREDHNSHPVLCKIERILKVHNTQRTISRFEDYRDAVKSRAALHAAGTTSISVTNSTRPGKKNPRCAADGNELLRFHCTTLTCSLGAHGSTSLCAGASPSLSSCGVCTIIRNGFGKAQQEHGKGVRTTASSGTAHDCCGVGAAGEGGKRKAMLVCRVIAGRVRRAGDDPPAAASQEEENSGGGYDSVAGRGGGGKGGGSGGGVYANGNLEELFVANPKAILPCFVVVYRTWE